jgi:NAD(P)-dependent dehydrogenase (short-subunit alcohol dehydrogenase family)
MDMVTGRLQGKVAVVTGSGRGIGRCEAMALAREGAMVVVSDFGKDEHGRDLAAIVTEEILAAGGKAIAVTENLMTAEGAQRTIEAAKNTFGGLDIIVNNAGLRGGNPIHKLTEEQLDSVLGSHLKASFLMIKYGVPYMRERGGGVIINTGSEAGLGMVFNSAYASAKEGLAGLTRKRRMSWVSGSIDTTVPLMIFAGCTTTSSMSGIEMVQLSVNTDWQANT